MIVGVLFVALSLVLPTFPERPQSLVLVGDSVAGSMSQPLVDVAGARGTAVSVHARGGCGLTDGVVLTTVNPAGAAYCARTTPSYLASLPPADAVVWYSSWEVNSHVVGGTRLEFRTPEWDAWFTGQLDAVRERYPVLVLVTIPPRQPVNGRPTMFDHEIAATQALNDFFRAYAAARPTTVALLDLATMLCPAGCPEFIDGIRPRPDHGAHFDQVGAEWLAPRFLDALQAEWERIGALTTAPDGLF